MSKRRERPDGRRRPTQLREDERAEVLAMRRAGYTCSAIASTLDRSEGSIRKVLHDELMAFRGAPLVLDGEPSTREERYLQWHAQATAVAAAQGDAKPAMDMLDRLGVVPETSRDRTLLQVSREKNLAQTQIANAYGARPGQSATVNIGIGFPAQLSGGDFQVQAPASVRLSSKVENQRLTGTENRGLTIGSLEVVEDKEG